MPPPYHPAPPPTRRELRGFARSVGGALLILAGVASWRGRAGVALAVGAGGVALLVAGAVAPTRLARTYRGWMRVALAISAVTTPLLMAVVYFGVLTPLALVTRLAGRRAIGVRADAPTAWVDRPPGTRRSDLRRQF